MLVPLVIPAATTPSAVPPMVPLAAGGDAFRLLFDGLAEELPATDQPFAEIDVTAAQIAELPVAKPPRPDGSEALIDILADPAAPVLADPAMVEPPVGDVPMLVAVADDGRKAPLAVSVGAEPRTVPTLAQRLVVRQMAEQAAALPAPSPDPAPQPVPSAAVPLPTLAKTKVVDLRDAGNIPPVADVPKAEPVQIVKTVTKVARGLDPVVAPAPATPQLVAPVIVPDAPAPRVKAGLVFRDIVTVAALPSDETAPLSFGAEMTDSPFGASVERMLQGSITRLGDPPQPGLARHVAQQIAVTVSQAPGQPTEIALNPEELGRVRMSMAMADGAMMVQILAERPETADLLRRHIDTLAQEFRDLGYRDVSFDFGGDRAPHRQDHEAGTTSRDTGVTLDGPEATPAAAPRVTTGLDLRL